MFILVALKEYHAKILYLINHIFDINNILELYFSSFTLIFILLRYSFIKLEVYNKLQFLSESKVKKSLKLLENNETSNYFQNKINDENRKSLILIMK